MNKYYKFYIHNELVYNVWRIESIIDDVVIAKYVGTTYILKSNLPMGTNKGLTTRYEKISFFSSFILLEL